MLDRCTRGERECRIQYDYDSLPVKYVRHRTNISRDGLRDLYERHLIGVHWKNIRSQDPADYDPDGGRDDIKTLNDVDESRAIVAAFYGSDYKTREGIHKSKLFIGVIPPETFEYNDFPEINGELTMYKTLKFDEDTLEQISITERPDLFSDVPARGTIRNCIKTEDRLREIVDPNKSPSPIDSPRYLVPKNSSTSALSI